MPETGNLECLICGKTFQIPKFVNIENYNGQVVCQNCGSLLHIRLIQSKVRQYKVVEEGFRNEKAEEIQQVLGEAEQEYGHRTDSGNAN